MRWVRRGSLARYDSVCLCVDSVERCGGSGEPMWLGGPCGGPVEPVWLGGVGVTRWGLYGSVSPVVGRWSLCGSVGPVVGRWSLCGSVVSVTRWGLYGSVEPVWPVELI